MDMIQQQEHYNIKQTTDMVYLQTIEKAAALQNFLQNPRGNINTPFLDFYYSFSTLYMLTGNRKVFTKEVEGAKDEKRKMRDNVKKWFNPDLPINEKRAKIGLIYFATWQEILEHVGIISP